MSNSLVYIYQDVAGYVTCCGCSLDPDDFHTRSLLAMLAHVAKHRAAGHPVPEWIDADLRRRWPFGDEPVPDGAS